MWSWIWRTVMRTRSCTSPRAGSLHCTDTPHGKPLLSLALWEKRIRRASNKLHVNKVGISKKMLSYKEFFLMAFFYSQFMCTTIGYLIVLVSP